MFKETEVEKKNKRNKSTYQYADHYLSLFLK